ncbi:MAG TPA: ATP-binding protein [Rhodocyclaceae bacterium]|nr:ATP-binding protein [Rhodocyclaceae bacterium]
MNTHAQTSGEDAAADPQAEARRLAEAFRIFNQASEELSTAYTALQSQVAELTAELAAANGALRQQYLEKVALTERLALLLDALPAGVILIGHDNVVVQTNPAADAILARPLQGAVWPECERECLTATEVPGEYRAGSRQVAMNVTALDSSGVRIVLLHDVSETHALKQQAERSQRLAAMGEMAAQLAHQLRTPLAAALLYTGNLELPSMADESRISIAGKAVGRLKHLERLIQDMLLFARGEVLGRESFAVQGLLEELRQIFEPLAQQRGIVLAIPATEAVTAPGNALLQLTGNRKAIAGALTNLLENAFDAAASRVVLAVQADGSSIDFVVEDNGKGIPQETLDRMFEPFFTTRVEGSGLGLAIARGVARAHGGSIEVSSCLGEGTRFVMRLQRVATMGQDTEQ